MDKPPKGNLRLLVIISLVVGTLVVTGFFLFVFFGKTAWRDLEISKYAQNVQTQVYNNGGTKTTTYTAEMDSITASEDAVGNLFRIGWDSIIVNGIFSDHFAYIDQTKNFSIFSLEYRNDCPAFYLDLKVESVSNNVSKVTLVQTVGPCGKPLS